MLTIANNSGCTIPLQNFQHQIDNNLRDCSALQTRYLTGLFIETSVLHVIIIIIIVTIIIINNNIIIIIIGILRITCKNSLVRIQKSLLYNFILK